MNARVETHTTLEAFFKKACEALHSHPEDYEEVAIVCGGA